MFTPIIVLFLHLLVFTPDSCTGRYYWAVAAISSKQCKPIPGVWGQSPHGGRAPSWVQGQSPWSGCQGGKAPLKLERKLNFG